ncbi:MAG: ATP-binding cassette domain-containing protein [Myxococcota bacterium]
MPSLRAQHLGFSFDSHVVFEDLSFQLGAGWTGLVGANGVGKTTLLRLITGELQPGSGALVREPRQARVVWCPQRVERRDESVDGLAWASDGLARRLHGRLRLDPDALERWSTLSPGERKRWQLGAALWSEPDVLLLDEPGNHLDVEALGWLRDVLREFRGVGVLVSHDRALLDDATNATLRLVDGGAQLFAHPFSAARELWLEEERQTREQQRETRRRLEKEERKVDARRRALSAASKQRSAGARMKDKYDSDARTLAADFRAEMAERSHAATLRRVERQAEGIRSELDRISVRDEAGQALFLRYEPCPKSTVVQFSGDVRAGEVTLLREVSFQLRRDEKVWLRGPNGAGKTTLLSALLAACAVPPERQLVLPQELTLDDALADLAHVKALPPDARGRVLQLVHALGVEPEALLRSAAPSPGEARKLRLALGLGGHAWLAALDEPTNHLDLPAIERLEAALVAFPGAVLLVTHDEQLGRRVATREWVLGAR